MLQIITFILNCLFDHADLIWNYLSASLLYVKMSNKTYIYFMIRRFGSSMLKVTKSVVFSMSIY